MRFKCETVSAKRLRLQRWHKTFAWYPIRVSKEEYVWLEKVWVRYPYAWIGPYSGDLFKDAPQYKANNE